MAYTTRNFKTKKALKDAVAEYNNAKLKGIAAKAVTAYQPNDMGFGPDLSRHTGRVYLEGPHYPEPHKWYAQAEMIDGNIVKVK
jgi:hypothetical protein